MGLLQQRARPLFVVADDIIHICTYAWLSTTTKILLAVSTSTMKELGCCLYNC